MNKAARYSMLVIFAAFGSYSMLIAGTHPGLVLFVILGLVLFVGGLNAVTFRAALRRGKKDELVGSFMDLLELTRRDWRDIAYIALGSLLLLATGLAAFGGGSN